MSNIPITKYNDHTFINLEYHPTLGILYYKNKEIPWKINKSQTYNKKANEVKTYVYQTVVIPDATGKKHKIFREKFEKTYATKLQPPTQEPTQVPTQEPPVQEQEPPTQEKEKEKQEKEKQEKPADPCYDVHQQMLALQTQRMMDEDEMIAQYLQTYNLEDGHIFEIHGRKWFII
jgi:hypothetical protein